MALRGVPVALRAFQWLEEADKSVYFLRERQLEHVEKKRDIHEDVSCGKEASLIRAC